MSTTIPIFDGLRKALEGVGYAVVDAGSAEDALLLCDASVDAILVDVILPGMNGLDFCRRLRADGVSLPIVSVSMRSQGAERAAGFAAGADAYVTKPFRLQNLLQRVESLVKEED